jgi:hypothetical protein
MYFKDTLNSNTKLLQKTCFKEYVTEILISKEHFCLKLYFYSFSLVANPNNQIDDPRLKPQRIQQRFGHKTSHPGMKLHMYMPKHKT